MTPLLERGRRTETGGSREARGRHRRGRAGQSLAEFALVLPVFLLLTLIAIDFGRVYLGWVNLQNMARVAANYAANHPTAWAANDAAAKAAYQNEILADAKANNCILPTVAGQQTAPDPAFPGGTNIGGTAEVRLTCAFRILTPIIGEIVGSGGNVTVGASSTFPIKSAMFSNGSGGPGGVGTCTVPNLVGSSSADAEATWSAAGFVGQVKFKQGGQPWTIKSQTLAGNTAVSCDSPITVSKT